MAVIKNENTGKWEVRTYYKDAFTGERKQKTKRGFKKKSEAKAWEVHIPRNLRIRSEGTERHSA
jgi:hypothetical protein